MKAFFSFVIRWVIPLLGLLALSLIIWFVGPLLDVLVPAAPRWVLIILLFAGWLGYRLWRIVQARRQAAKVTVTFSRPGSPSVRVVRRVKIV